MSDQVVPASYQQRQIWLAERGAPPVGLYHEVCGLDLDGRLDVSALEAALNLVVLHHEALRTTFTVNGSELLQAVHAASPLRLATDVRDLSGLAEETRQATALSAARHFTEAPFDLATGPLFRCALFKLSPSRHILVLNVHHIVCDGWSLGLTLEELRNAYVAICTSAEPDAGSERCCYQDFAEWQRREIGSDAWSAGLHYWKGRLAGAPAMTELPASQPRPPVRTYRGRRDLFRFSEKSRESLAALRAEAFGSQAVPLIATWAILMYRYTGRTDLIIGTAAHGRPQGYERTVGLFANLVPVRITVNGQMTVDSCLHGVADEFLDAIDYSAVPFEGIVDVAQPARDPGFPPLVQVVCTISDDYAPWSRFGELSVAPIDVPRERARFDLLIEHELNSRDGWIAHVEYDGALFDPEAIGRLMCHYQQLIETSAENIRVRIAALPMLRDDERARMCSGGRAVLDPDGNVLPAGAVGELALHPGTDQEERSGRVARRSATGQVEDLGALQRRVRISQLDLQLEHVEALLRGHPAVVAAAVVVRPGREERPVAYVAPAGVALDEVWSYLKARLPRVLLPADVIPAVSIAYGPDGDPVVTPALSTTTEEVPADRLMSLESQLLGVWGDVLEQGQIGRDDDFFGMGGRSMTASHAAQRIGDLLGIDLSVRLIFENPTVAELAPAIAALAAEQDAPDRPLQDEPVATGRIEPVIMAPVSSAQLQIWLNQQLTKGARDDFNSSFACRLRGPLNVGLLRLAFHRAVRQHPSFGCWLEETGDLPIARFGAGSLVQMEVLDLRESPGNRAARARRLARELASEPFELHVPPLVRAQLIRLSDTDHVLVYVMHHVVTDGVSAGILHRDLREFYTAAAAGRDPLLPAQEAHYADYVAWERDWLATDAAQTRRFWAGQLAGWRELRLPVTGEGRKTLAVASSPYVLSPAQTASVVAIARRSRATTFMVVCAAYAAVLHDWSDSADIVFGSLVDNRPQARFLNVTGCFANFVPLRVSCTGTMTFGDLVEAVRDAVLRAYEHQHLPYAEIVHLAGARRSFSRMPLFQVTAQWALSDTLPELPGCRSEPWTVGPPVSRFELTLFAAEQEQRLKLELEYATDLWDEATVASRCAQLAEVLVHGSASAGDGVGALLRRSATAARVIARADGLRFRRADT